MLEKLKLQSLFRGSFGQKFNKNTCLHSFNLAQSHEGTEKILESELIRPATAEVIQKAFLSLRDRCPSEHIDAEFLVANRVLLETIKSLSNATEFLLGNLIFLV